MRTHVLSKATAAGGKKAAQYMPRLYAFCLDFMHFASISYTLKQSARTQSVSSAAQLVNRQLSGMISHPSQIL